MMTSYIIYRFQLVAGPKSGAPVSNPRKQIIHSFLELGLNAFKDILNFNVIVFKSIKVLALMVLKFNIL